MKVGPAMWVGEARSGRPHGEGDLILANGAVHHGSFEDGRASGAGVYHEASGTVMIGNWVDNKRSGTFKTIDPKGGEWTDTYDDDGKRTSRKKAAPPGNAPGAAKCRHCGVKFHKFHNSRCRQHSGKWMAASATNADGSAAAIDYVTFPEGGLWLCCGSKSKDGGERCTVGVHDAAEVECVPEGRRIEEAAPIVQVARAA